MRFLTAGESHGKGYTGILEGMPAGLPISIEGIKQQLFRRQVFAGRSERMQMETDDIAILSGVRGKITLGSPISFWIANRDFRAESMDPIQGDWQKDGIFVPRPGHADYAGMVKYGFPDARNIAERASGRESVAKVAIGALCMQLLDALDIGVASYVCTIGTSSTEDGIHTLPAIETKCTAAQLRIFSDQVDKSPVRCAHEATAQNMLREIEAEEQAGLSLGGSVRVIVSGLPAGFGSHVHHDRRLDYRLSGHMAAIPSVKSVAFGSGTRHDRAFASETSLRIEKNALRYGSNADGGIEGGISNGQNVIMELAVKPVPTTKQPKESIDIRSKAPAKSHYERSDVCVVPTISVIAEHVAAYVIAETVLETLGGDTMEELTERFMKKKEKGLVTNHD